MKKFIIAGAAVMALAIPSVASASQPVNPGGFGQERSDNIHTYFTQDGYGTWGNPTDGNGIDGASDRKGDNSLNTTYMRTYDNSLPAESHAGLKK